jgi:transcriptional regulator with XRE-family HTH domain
MLAVVPRDANSSRDHDSLVAFSFVGRNIRNLRRVRKVTQAELGSKLRRRRLSRQAIGEIEAGGNTDLETMSDIAAALDVDLSTLMENGAQDPEARKFEEKLHASKRPADFFRALADIVDQFDQHNSSDRKDDR